MFHQFPEVVSIAKVFPNDAAEQDTLLVEINFSRVYPLIGTEAFYHVLSPLLILSSQFITYLDHLTLERGIPVSVMILLDALRTFDYSRA